MRRLERPRIANALTYLALFLLPWQTRWIFFESPLGGDVWEYGKLSVYATEVVVLLAFLLRGRLRLGSYFTKPVSYGAVLLAIIIMSAAFSSTPEVSFTAAMHVGAAMGLFLLLLDERLNSRRMIEVFVCGLLLPSLLGWYQTVTGTSPASTLFGLAEHLAATPGASVVETESGRVLRAYGSFNHPNEFGGFLAAGVLLIAWLVRETKRAFDPRLAGLLLILSGTLVITFSRSGWLAAAAAIAVVACLLLWHGKAWPHDAIPLAALALLVLFVTIIAFREPLFTRFDPTARLEEKSLTERQAEWPLLDDVIATEPFTGVGVGAYTASLAELFPGSPSWSYQPIHNVFALLVAEIGFVGFLVFVRWIVSIDLINARAAKTRHGMFGMALGTVLLVLALFDHYLWTSWSGLAFAAFSFALMLRWSTWDQVKTRS